MVGATEVCQEAATNDGEDMGESDEDATLAEKGGKMASALAAAAPAAAAADKPRKRARPTWANAAAVEDAKAEREQRKAHLTKVLLEANEAMKELKEAEKAEKTAEVAAARPKRSPAKGKRT